MQPRRYSGFEVVLLIRGMQQKTRLRYRVGVWVLRSNLLGVELADNLML